jgi:hypothetical protein
MCAPQDRVAAAGAVAASRIVPWNTRNEHAGMVLVKTEVGGSRVLDVPFAS